MSTISISEIQQNPSDFLKRVEKGEAFVVMRDEQPVAEVKPMTGKTSQKRPFGLCAGAFSVPGDFDHPLPERTLQEFEGE